MVVGEAEYTYALLLEVCSSLCVVIVLVVMAGAVKLDTKLTCGTVEIENEWADALLTAKFKSVGTTTL